MSSQGLGFTEDQVQRYSRHIILPNIGGAGQRKLVDSKVFVIGAGGLGSPTLLYLAAAGIGTIGVVDFDRVDLSNLQRQILHTNADIDRPNIGNVMPQHLGSHRHGNLAHDLLLPANDRGCDVVVGRTHARFSAASAAASSPAYIVR